MVWSQRLEDMVTLHPTERSCILFHYIKAVEQNWLTSKNAGQVFKSEHKNWSNAATRGRSFDRVINLKLTEKLINAFTSFHDSVLTLESKFFSHVVKRNSNNWNTILKILSNFPFLARQSLPLRGDDDGSNFNFTELYLLQEEDNLSLKNGGWKCKQISTLITLFRM